MTTSFFQEISSFATAFPGIDLSAMPRIAEQFSHVPILLRSRAVLWPEFAKMYPELFSQTFSRSNGSIVSVVEQEYVKATVLDAATKRGVGDCVIDALQTIADSYMKMNAFYAHLIALFPRESFAHAFRVKDVVRANTLVDAAFPRWATDVVGARVVPKNIQDFPKAIQDFEREFADEILFKTNTFPMNDEDMIRDIGPFSVPYRAVHYYLPLGKYCFEVQFRSPAIDVWSAIHHDTMYKPRVPLSSASRDALMQFGEECCVVDAYALVKGDLT